MECFDVAFGCAGVWYIESIWGMRRFKLNVSKMQTCAFYDDS